MPDFSSQPLRVPSYRHQKSRNLAVVRIDGKDHYLGPYGSPESKEKYHRLIYEWLTRKPADPDPSESKPAEFDPTINELILAYWRHAESYYVRDGEATSELSCLKQALRPLHQLYDHTPAKEFGPLALKAVREAMIRSGRARTAINRDVHRLRRVFKWAASEQLVPSSVYEALRTVEPLKAGRSPARETEPVKPVPIEAVNATLRHLSPIVRAMVELQLVTGARPGEICSLRPGDIDRSDPSCWLYRPRSHKTQHRGKDRVIAIGPQAQVLVKPFLDRDPSKFCFSPVEAVAGLNAVRKANGRTPLTPSRKRRRRKANPRKAPGHRYTKDAFCRAISTACDKAFPHEVLSSIRRKHLTDEQRRELRAWQRSHRWHPHQLRHSRATELRSKFGIEAAQLTLGHATPSTTLIYAERDLAKLKAIANQVG